MVENPTFLITYVAGMELTLTPKGRMMYFFVEFKQEMHLLADLFSQKRRIRRVVFYTEP